jgi:hypothetical protein
MRILIAFIFVFIGLTAVSAQTGKEISVKVNETASAGNGVRVKFVEMVEDSRCPTDTDCVWAGNAKIKIRVTRNGRSKVLELNSNLQPKTASFAGYIFRLIGLTPEPRSNIRINRFGYVATIEMRKVR